MNNKVILKNKNSNSDHPNFFRRNVVNDLIDGERKYVKMLRFVIEV